jgi:hypothetical protein
MPGPFFLRRQYEKSRSSHLPPPPLRQPAHPQDGMMEIPSEMCSAQPMLHPQPPNLSSEPAVLELPDPTFL